MSRKTNILSAIVATTALTSALVGATAGTAAADQPFQTAALAYSCEYPVIGPGPLQVEASFQGPDSVASGGTVQAYDVKATATVPADIVGLLYEVGGIDGVRGSAGADIGLTNGTPTPLSVSGLEVAEHVVTDPAAALPVQAVQGASSVVPAITAGDPGEMTAALQNFEAQLEFRLNDGTWGAPEPFSCTLDDPASGSFSPSLTVS